MAFEPPAISSISVQLPAGMSEQCILRASSLNGWMSELELVWLAITAHIKGGDIVEVGSFLGRSTAALADNAPDSTVYAVDNWTGSMQDNSAGWWALVMLDREPDWLYTKFLDNKAANVVPTRMDSFTAAEYFKTMGRRFSMIFLDDDHEENWLKREIQAWAPLLADGGVLCGHDYCTGWGVIPAVDALLPKRSIVPKTTIWFIKKEDICFTSSQA